MADVYEQNLASKSTLATTDYIRVVGSDNVSYKQLVSDVAKKIIENYTGSTLGGSAQSVKSAVDSLNSKVGNIVYYYKNIGTGYNSYVARLTELISDSEFPTERAFVGCMLSGSYHYISGYLDANKNGGIVCINFNGGGLFRVSSGTVSQII